MMIRILFPVKSTNCVPAGVKSNVRSLSFLNLKNTFLNFFSRQEPKPPYEHICQIGDPVLRAQVAAVNSSVIKSRNFQRAITKMIKVMRQYRCYGLAAPQIGIRYPIFAIEFPEEYMKKFDATLRKECEIEVIPLQVFINPVLRITDPEIVELPEQCASITGFTAIVPRARAVEIYALDRNGEPIVWSAKGWTARIAQHEYDHLCGTLYTDKMNKATLSCNCWEAVNKYRGKIQLRYNGQ